MKRIANGAFSRFALLCLSVLCLGSKLNAQTEEPTFFDAEKQMVLETKTSVLLENARRDSALYQAGRNAAIQIALKNGLPIDARKRDGSISLQGFDGTGLLGYYASDNAISAAILKTTQLYPDEVAELTLTGAGKTMGIWEVGRARLTHQEFAGRITQADYSSVSPDNHSNHVSGTMIAAGIDSEARGMAYEALLRAYDSINDASEMGTAAAAPTSIRVSNHSYGWICGWDYDLYQGQPTWYWWGNPAISQTTDYKFGQYDSRARNFDNVVYNAPFYLPVFAAGNDRSNTGPAPGGSHVVRNASNQWVQSNTVRQADGGSAGYDCIPASQCAKNVLTVGAIEAEIDNDLIITNMSSFSSWGPTDDGRIKPDIVSRGVNVYSCKGNSNDDYYTNSGTSMAAPSVTGSLQLLLEHYTNLNPGFTIRASALKGLVIQTASDSEGPNYEEGWGLMNTRAAADLMSHSFNSNSKDRLISRDSVTNGSQREYSFYYDGSGPLQATIVWTDPAGTVSSNTVNPTQLRLVNDLDLRLIREDDNTTYFPWILDPVNPSAPATKGDNFRDNVEQIFESDLPQGRYKLRVNHKGTLSGGTQFYSMILSGRSNLLTACSGAISVGSSGNYLSDLHYSWTISPPNASTVTLNFSSFETETNFDFVRVYDGDSASDPLLGEFSGNALPPSLTASSGKMFLVFDTNISVNYPGWSATYSCGSAQLSVNTNSLSSGSDANLNTFNITSDCNWSISGVPAWASVSPLSGNSNAQVQVNFSVNNSTSTRTATLQITGCDGITLTVVLTQFGCSAPAAPTMVASGSTNLCPGESVTLTASDACAGCNVYWSTGQSGSSILVSTAGNYSATVGNTCGVSPASNTITVTTETAPTIPILSASGPTSLCPGESVTLTVSNICAGCDVHWSNGQTGPSITISTTGTYLANQSNTCGFGLPSNTISITAAPPFLPTVQVNNLCHLAAPTGSNYQWYLNGTAISGATGQFWSAQTSGYYVVSMTNSAGCAGISDPVFAEACVSHTVNLSERLSLLLFPNPARDKVTLELQSPVEISEVRLELYGFDGRWVGLLFQSELLSGDSTLELSLPELPAGMYQYRLSSRQGALQGSLVILP